MRVECRLALNQLRDHGGQHGQESEEGKEGKEDSQEEKEVAVRRKPHSIRIASEVRYAPRSTDRQQLLPTEYPTQQTVKPAVPVANHIRTYL